jgi:hypothetical protein
MLMAGIDSVNDVHAIKTDTKGRIVDVRRGADAPIRKYVALAGVAETTVWDPTAGTKFVITDIIVSCTANAGITFRDGTAGATFMSFIMLANTTISMNFQTPLMSIAADNNFTAQTSAATVAITVSGYEEP